MALGSAREHTPLSLSLSRVWDSTAILGIRDTIGLATRSELPSASQDRGTRAPFLSRDP